jgi:fused signal recognition particle receptor
MFGKLKDKLKGALNVFSKKAEEVAEEKEVEQEVEEKKEEEVVAEVSEEKEVEEPEQVEKTSEKEPAAEVAEEKVEPVVEKKEEEKLEEKEPEFTKDKETDISEEELEKVDQLIDEAKKEEVAEVPTKFTVGKNKFEPDLEEIKEEEKEAEPTEDKESEESKEETDDDDAEKFVPIPEESNDREIPSAESLIEETKEKFAVEELPQEEQDKIKEAERQPTAAELLEEVADEVVEDEKEEASEEPVKEKKLFGLFKRKEKKKEIKEVPEEKEVTEIEKEETKEEKVIEEPTKEVAEEVPKEKEPETEEKKGFFGKVKQSFTTKTISADKFETLFWELEMALLENNVSVEVIEKIKVDLQNELVDKPLPRDVPKKIEETLKRTLTEILTFDKINILEKAKNKKPLVIAFFGINGSGKTTSIAKLANYFKENNLSVVLAACDTFRAAAIQQLEEHANKLDVKMIKHDYGSDAAAVAFDAVKYAEKSNTDVVLIDTAGRLHSNTNLMAELEKIIRVTKPDLKIFIGESITGNDCIEQARKFNELVEMDGAILTKADVDEKGGAPLSIAYTIKKPILFLGMGQEYKDFEEFDKKVILDRLGF